MQLLTNSQVVHQMNNAKNTSTNYIVEYEQ